MWHYSGLLFIYTNSHVQVDEWTCHHCSVWKNEHMVCSCWLLYSTTMESNNQSESSNSSPVERMFALHGSGGQRTTWQQNNKQNGCQQADRPTKMTGWIIWTAGWQNKLMNMKYIYKWMFSSWWPSHSSPLRMITPGSLSATVCSTNLPHQQSSTMLQPKTAVFSSNKDDTFQNEHDFMSSLGSPQPQHVGRDPSLIGNRRIQDWRTPAQHTRINSNWWHHWAVNLTLISFHIVDDTVSATGNTWADTKDINKPKTSAPSNLWSTTHLHLNKQQVFWQTCLNQSTLQVTTTNCSRTSAITPWATLILIHDNDNTEQQQLAEKELSVWRCYDSHYSNFQRSHHWPVKQRHNISMSPRLGDHQLSHIWKSCFARASKHLTFDLYTTYLHNLS